MTVSFGDIGQICSIAHFTGLLRHQGGLGIRSPSLFVVATEKTPKWKVWV